MQDRYRQTPQSLSLPFGRSVGPKRQGGPHWKASFLLLLRSSFSAVLEGRCFYGFIVALCSCGRVFFRPYGAEHLFERIPRVAFARRGELTSPGANFHAPSVGECITARSLCSPRSEIPDRGHTFILEQQRAQKATPDPRSTSVVRLGGRPPLRAGFRSRRRPQDDGLKGGVLPGLRIQTESAPCLWRMDKTG